LVRLGFHFYINKSDAEKVLHNMTVVLHMDEVLHIGKN